MTQIECTSKRSAYRPGSWLSGSVWNTPDCTMSTVNPSIVSGILWSDWGVFLSTNTFMQGLSSHSPWPIPITPGMDINSPALVFITCSIDFEDIVASLSLPAKPMPAAIWITNRVTIEVVKTNLVFIKRKLTIPEARRESAPPAYPATFHLSTSYWCLSKIAI